ncbi:hypothetical protein C2869_10535 [Saccharobesus litoralis]|uniref:undecaprenyl-diphosphate phosphatase n=1 Tax=Saccharobesus litoralis TaxID=2172099 RepID=A0A2S0VRK3_9ALTE|nr:phosphatase PAP2 family protein [Saccharobesus litoralis]AWB66841.1 hypothetical protein C2869_10535 [Saccharobesus litoralis]
MLNPVTAVRNSYLVKGLRLELAHGKRQLINANDEHLFSQLSFVAFGLLALAAVLYSVQGYHVGFYTINDLGHYLPSDLWQMTTYLGDTATCLCLMVFFARRFPAALWIIFIAAVYGLVVTHGMKAGFGQLRPPAVLEPETYHLIGNAFTKGSFPSGHSFSIFVFVTTCYYFSKQTSTRVCLVAFGLIVACSRVMVAAHWPVDTLVGSALGILVTLAAVYTAKRWLVGMVLPVHFIVLSLMLIATIKLFGHDGGYPAVTPFAWLLATSALAFFISEYFVTPYASAKFNSARQIG